MEMPLLTELGLRLRIRFYKHGTPTELISRGFGGDGHQRPSGEQVRGGGIYQPANLATPEHEPLRPRPVPIR